MLAVFQLRIRQKYKVEVCHVTSGKVCEPMAEGWKKLLANGRGGEVSAGTASGTGEELYRVPATIKRETTKLAEFLHFKITQPKFMI